MFIVGMVNYKSSVYMETQFKIYRDFAGEPFKIIIAENSMNLEEQKALLDIVSRFSIPIRVIPYGQPGTHSSDAHGSALQHIYKIVCQTEPNAEYFLTQDPDFFWVKPQFLTFLKDKLTEHCVVGAPYNSEEKSGYSTHPWFPTAFGSAHRIRDLKEINANFRCQPNPFKDVGWYIRESLCTKPYYSFQQIPFKPIGKFTFRNTNHSRQFVDKGQAIAYHLHRGSFEIASQKALRMAKGSEVAQKKLIDTMPPDEWQINRKRMCDFFWREINAAAK